MVLMRCDGARGKSAGQSLSSILGCKHGGPPWNHPAVATDAKTNWHRRLLRKHSPLEEAGWGGAPHLYCFVPIPSDVTLFVPLPLSAPTESAEIRHGGSGVRATTVEGYMTVR